MSKQTKLLARLCRKPPPSDLTWDELVTLMGRLGYVLLKNGGSRRKFFNKDRSLIVICHEPHPEPTVDKGCVVDVVEHLKTNGIIEEDDNGHP